MINSSEENILLHPKMHCVINNCEAVLYSVHGSFPWNPDVILGNYCALQGPVFSSSLFHYVDAYASPEIVLYSSYNMVSWERIIVEKECRLSLALLLWILVLDACKSVDSEWCLANDILVNVSYF